MSNHRYLGICDTYTRAAPVIGVYAPMALAALVNSLMGKSAESTGEAVSFTFAAASAGVIAGIIAHAVMNEYLDNRGIGLSRGGKMMRAAQATVYAVPVALSLIFNAAGMNPITHIRHRPASKPVAAEIRPTLLASPSHPIP